MSWAVALGNFDCNVFIASSAFFLSTNASFKASGVGVSIRLVVCKRWRISFTIASSRTSAWGEIFIKAGWIVTGTEDNHWLVGRPLESTGIGFLNSRVIVVEFAKGWSGLYCLAHVVFETCGDLASSGILVCCLCTIRR